jgi:hypothetical protein
MAQLAEHVPDDLWMVCCMHWPMLLQTRYCEDFLTALTRNGTGPELPHNEYSHNSLDARRAVACAQALTWGEGLDGLLHNIIHDLFLLLTVERV